MEEFELKTSLEGFTKDSEQERDELKALCEDALHFLEKMESTCDTIKENREIKDTTEGIETFHPQLAHLRQRSEEIFTAGVITRRLEFEPVLENIYDRWYKLVKGADTSSASQDVPPLTSIIKAEPVLHLNKDTNFPAFDDTDEVIDTLPEDDSLTNSNQSSPLKRNLPVSPIATSNKSNIESNKSTIEETSIKKVCIVDTNLRSPERNNIGAITYSLGDELNNRPPSPPIATSYEHNVHLSSESRGRERKTKSKELGKYPNQKGQYPKPNWYVNSKELHQVRRANDLVNQRKTNSSIPGISPERVKVTVNVLPSPQKTSVSSVTTEITKVEMQSKQSKPESSVFPLTSSSSTSSPTTSTPSSVCGERLAPRAMMQPPPYSAQDEQSQNHDKTEDDECIESENKDVERLLSVMDSDLAEVIYKGQYLQAHGRGRVLADKSYTKRSQEVQSYATAIYALLDKISLAKENILDMNKERDLSLRRDLIDMELRLLEAEVGTLLSRGSALTLMLQHGNEQHGEQHGKQQRGKNDAQEDFCKDVEEKSNVLRDAWSDVKRQAELEKSKVLNTSDLINFYKNTFRELEEWMGRNKNVNDIEEKRIVNKRKLFHNIECLADRLRKDDAFSDFEKSYSQLVKQWDAIERKTGDGHKLPSYKSGKTNNNISPNKKSNNNKKSKDQESEDTSTTNHVETEPTSPSKKLSSSINLATRIEKLRNAIKAINRQLGTQILSGRELENLKLQKETLDTVKEALDRLKTKVQAAEKDVESLFSSHGSMSVEFLEKLTGLNEKLQEEWKWVNNRYNERQNLWTKSDEIMQSFDKKQTELLDYLKNEILHKYGEKLDQDIEIARTKIANHVMDCQEIRSKLSTQEASKGKI